MVISEKNKYIFIAVPKTGTTSVSSFLLKHDSSAVKNSVQVNGKAITISEHITAADLKVIMGEDYSRYRVFAFVRHPFSKILSGYYFYRDGRAARKVKMGNQSYFVGFKVFLAKALPFSVWSMLYPYKSCSDHLLDKNGQLLVNYVGYFENLQKDFSRILEDVGVDPEKTTLPHLNSSAHDEIGAYIGEGLLKKILLVKVKKDMRQFYS